MKVSPIILRFFSGSVTPASLSRKVLLASMLTSSTPSLVLKVASTCSRSPVLSSPLSTKTRIKFCGIAAAKSAAVTELSTPPLTAQRTFLLPTVSLILAIWFLAKLPIFHVLSQPQIYLAKFFKI